MGFEAVDLEKSMECRRWGKIGWMEVGGRERVRAEVLTAKRQAC